MSGLRARQLVEKSRKTFPPALKRVDTTGFMSGPFEAQDKLKSLCGNRKTVSSAAKAATKRHDLCRT